jgi:hypothetical protein
MADGFIVAGALFACHPLVELLHGEGLSSSVSLNVGGDLRRELGGEIRRFFACQPLPYKLSQKG